MRNGLISIFIRHKVAANLLMMLMFLAGFWGINKLNIQFLPSFEVQFISINTLWPGASAEDVARSITIPMDKELNDLDSVKEIRSTSTNGSSLILIEFDQDTDMSKALEDVRKFVTQVRNLPTDSETPVITRNVFYEPVTTLLITGVDNLQELRPLINEMERELLSRGIAKIKITGLPDEEIAIQIPSRKLEQLNLSLNQISQLVRQRSRDIPAGTIGRYDATKQLRTLEQQRQIKEFEKLAIITENDGQLLRLGDIAKIERRPREPSPLVYYREKPAVELRLLRTGNTNALDSARIAENWLSEMREKLPPNIEIVTYQNNWELIKDRINLLLKNGVSGLILIVLILFLFLNTRVAGWVALGIPISFIAALSALYLFDGSINMISLFALIMALGIIVDDNIVVGEEALTQIQKGISPKQAITNAAYKMLAPIMASSLTTISAFLPLLLIGGIIGVILAEIPLVIICVIIASVIECFLILPGHLAHSFHRKRNLEEPQYRQRINQTFDRFRDQHFRKFVTTAIKRRAITITAAVALLVLAIGLLLGGRLQFQFFPIADGTTIQANVQFIAGTRPEKLKTFLSHLDNTLWQTNAEQSDANEPIVLESTRYQNIANLLDAATRKTGLNYATLNVELIPADNRSLTNQQFIDKWREHIVTPPEVEALTIISPQGGPPGRDIDIEITGSDNVAVLKEVAIELTRILNTYDGVNNVEDNIPFSTEQFIYELNPTGQSLGLTIDDIGQQVRAAFSGEIVQIFHETNNEVEVKAMLIDNERYSLASLATLPIITPQGANVKLGSVININAQKGLDIIRHTNGQLTSNVSADVDESISNNNVIMAALEKNALPALAQKHGVKFSFGGKATEQSDTLGDMKAGLLIAFGLIYIILAWVFSSYVWPLIVMLAIPLGLTGAIFGHAIMGINLTLLSLFGLFGLSGIVINDSIILLTRYRTLKHSGMGVYQAIIESSCQRLRAVLLTSLTTIAGLTPLLFETSLQAQFLIPMAVSISFGLAYATVLILIVIPAFLSIYEGYTDKLRKQKIYQLKSKKSYRAYAK